MDPQQQVYFTMLPGLQLNPTQGLIPERCIPEPGLKQRAGRCKIPEVVNCRLVERDHAVHSAGARRVIERRCHQCTWYECNCQRLAYTWHWRWC